MSDNSPPLAFVDTNILLYAHDHSAGDKQVEAAQLLARLWGNHSGILSAQVLQEKPPGLKFSTARACNTVNRWPG